MCTTFDIANVFGITRGSVNAILAPSSRAKGKKATAIREYAKKNGYDPKACGFRRSEGRPGHFWYNGNFHTKAEETARMKELREDGFSNAEIAKKIGRSHNTVWKSIGKQPEEMTKQNVALGQKIRAQKNAARKQYLINKPIIEYNRKVAEAEKVQAQLDALKKDLSIKKVAAEKSARAKVKCPSFSLETTTIAG